MALFIIWHDLKLGSKYRVNTIKPENLKSLTIIEGDISKSSPYEAVSYYLLEKILKSFRNVSNAASLIDLGCGKGRVMVVSAFFGFSSVTGIDFAKELCKEAEMNMKKIEPEFRNLKWKVICQDVLNYKIQSADTVFFMSNPFNQDILRNFLGKIETSLKNHPRTIWFLYAIPVHQDILQQFDYKVLQEIHPIRRLKAVIMEKQSLTPEITHRNDNDINPSFNPLNLKRST